MTKSTEEFSGYVDINKDRFAYFVSKNWVTLQPAVQDKNEQLASFERLRHYRNDSSEFFYGTDNVGKIALFRNSNIQVGLSYSHNNGIIESAGFGTPLIVKSKSYNSEITDWTYFDAIKFIGGNINSLHPPMQAIKNITRRRNSSHNQDISFHDDFEYSFKLPIVTDERSELFIFSVSIETNMDTAPSTRNFDCSSLGNINSYIRLSFNRRKKFNDIEKYFTLIKNLVSLLFGMSNVKFDVCLEQKNSCDEFVESAVCSFSDDYDDYSNRCWTNVVSLVDIMDYIPKIINKMIDSDGLETFFSVLPRSNIARTSISIFQVQDLCTMLEKGYEWVYEDSSISNERTDYIVGLRSAIKKCIKEFDVNHGSKDVNALTNVSSAFKYIDYTAKNKYFELCCRYEELLIILCEHLNISFGSGLFSNYIKERIKEFVCIRDTKTHTGNIVWNDSIEIFDLLIATVYACFFESTGMPKPRIFKIVQKLF